MSGFAPQLSLAGTGCFNVGGEIYPSSSQTGIGYSSPQPGRSSHHHEPNTEDLVGGLGNPPETRFLVTCPSGTREAPNARADPRNTEDSRKALSGGRFPHKLYLIMGSCNADSQELIFWNYPGDALIIPDPKKLEEAHVLDQYFNHNSWDAVVRQFHYYGFNKGNRAQKGDTRHVYYHCDFLRGRIDLLDKIKPRPQGHRSAKTFVARQQHEIEKMNKRIAHAEERIAVLEKEKKALEDENTRLRGWQNTLLQFFNSILQPPQRTPSTLLSTQPVGNGQYHAGSATHTSSFNPQAPIDMSQNIVDSLQTPYEFLLGHSSVDEPAISNSSYNRPDNDITSGSFAMPALWPWQPSVPATNTVTREAHLPSGPSVTAHPIQPAVPRGTFSKSPNTVQYIPPRNHGIGGYHN